MGKKKYIVGDETFQLGDMDIDQMERVRLDAANGVPASKDYTEEMLEYRRYFQAWMKTLPPEAIIDFPALS